MDGLDAGNGGAAIQRRLLGPGAHAAGGARSGKNCRRAGGLQPGAGDCRRGAGCPALAVRRWLSGDNFGIGDIPLGVIIYGWFGMEIERAELPALKAWYERLTERPAYRKTVMIPLT